MKLQKLPTRLLPTASRQALKSPSAAERTRGSALVSIRQRFFREHPCCVMCDAEGVTRAAVELDHIVPLALGGLNKDENIQLLRAVCNLNKGRKNPIAFMQERGFLL